MLVGGSMATQGMFIRCRLDSQTLWDVKCLIPLNFSWCVLPLWERSHDVLFDGTFSHLNFLSDEREYLSIFYSTRLIASLLCASHKQAEENCFSTGWYYSKCFSEKSGQYRSCIEGLVYHWLTLSSVLSPSRARESPTWRTNSHGWTDFSFSLSPRALTSSFTGDTSKESQTMDRNRCHVINWSWSLPRRSHCWLLIALLTTADDDQTNTQQMPTLLWLMAREKKSTEIWGWPPPPRDFCFFGESLFLSHSQGSCCLSDFLTHTLWSVCVFVCRGWSWWSVV